MTPPSPTFIPTPEQEAIRAAVRDPSGRSLMVEAGAGCAKSSTIELASRSIRGPSLALAFNKSIAKGLESRLPGNFAVKTMNGLGHMAWARVCAAQTLKVDDRKMGKLISEAAKDRRMLLSEAEWTSARALVERAMQQGLVPKEDPFASEALLADTPENWHGLALDLLLNEEEFVYVGELAQAALRAGIALARQGIISFDDQIYCSTLLGGKFPLYPTTVVDEDQDLNLLNVQMLGRSTRPDGRIIAVGDRHQGIYAFRGALGDAAKEIRALQGEDRWQDRPLMTSFRVPQVVALRQTHHVPDFVAAKGNPQGHFGPLAPFGQGWTIEQLLQAKPWPSASAVVLCRNNAPLIKLAFKCIREGTGVTMLGRDIGKGLQVLSRKICPQDNQPAESCVVAIQQWISHESSLLQANGKASAIAGVEDRGESLLAVLHAAQAKDAGQMRLLLERLFSNQNGLLQLGSAHKAKGLEWDMVVHLDPWRVPSRQARAAADRGDFAPLQQERNLRYVLETRTRHSLFEANLDELESSSGEP